MATRNELVTALAERYARSSKAERGVILDEFVAVSGYHRKHAIRLLRSGEKPTAAPVRRVRRRYGDAVREALIALWEASDRLCSKRLKPLLPVLLPALERHGRLVIEPDVRRLVLEISPASIDRLLSEVRLVASGGRRRRAGFSSAVRRAVPVRTFGDWNDPPPGFVEVDFVAHAGTSAAGSFVQTMVLTDVATGWTECLPVVVRNGALVIEALIAARTLFPFPLRGVDFDNDGAFMNEAVVDWCRDQGLEVTRSRAYRKNDQAWVEQKNGAIVRRLVGYGRLEGLVSAQALARLYAAARLHTNLYQPSFKLKEKQRIGARVMKRYHPPLPPLQRVLAHADVDEVSKTRLRALYAQADPVLLLAEVRAAQAVLGERVDRRGTQTASAQPIIADSARFAASLKTAWREGEQRATHRRPYRRRKPVPKRPSMLDAFHDQIRGWLDAEPALTAVAVLSRLNALCPEQFTDRHTRTVQRAVKAWRAHRARRTILDNATLLAAGAADPAASADVVPPPTPTPAGRPRGSTATPRASLRQAREGHGAMRGSPLWTPWTTRLRRDTRPSVTFPCEATRGISSECRPTAEGRTLTSGVLSTTARIGDWR